MWKKVLLSALVSLAIVVAGTVGYLYFRSPEMAPPWTGKIEATPERLARGRILFHNVTHCGDCHSRKDETRFGRPELPGGIGAGQLFSAGPDFPGSVTAQNLTPDPETGLGSWTDGEKVRAIREGVDKHGRALFPIMPYPDYGRLSDEDVKAIVVYMNSLAPVKNALPPSRINFPVNLLIKGAPRPVGHVPEPDRGDPLKLGEYLVHVAGCDSCHTPMVKGQHDYSKRFGGGRDFPGPNGIRVVSANISPDPETGIGRWSEAQFLEKFYQYRKYVDGPSPQVGPDGFTVMPWLGVCQWPEEDLKAVFAFLMRQKPVYQAVETRPGKS